ncbi:hypothetical protein [Streptomyces sp. NBC_00887]|uniref:SCO2400 family protein n=1 Tax=Streptomyces sp. NBC_00887 TaxID=2975859 RepID=UPI0038643BAA|nr:hypothetical protein OG844_34255 [Streptomyces sp. NBC_00887]
MDYCHPCRRHLNGALACAGCGTPADAPAPYADPLHSGHEPEQPGETLETYGSGGHRRRTRVAAAQGRGRRARRRRGRGILLTGIGVVLAVGALSLAELAIEPDGDDGAADYVSESTTAAVDSVPELRASEVPGDAAPVDSSPVIPAGDSHSDGAGEEPSGSPSPEKSASASAPADTPPSPSPPDPDDTEAPADPSSPGEPTSGPAQPEPTKDAAPTPSPSETCTRWLWFCT